MYTKENKELVRQVCKDANEAVGDVSKIRSAFDKYYAPGYIRHGPSEGDMNWEQALQFNVALFSAFPDLNFSIDDILAEGNKVAYRYTVRGTHKGTFMGITATEKRIVGKGVEIYMIAGGKIVEGWDFPDNLGVMTQLGVISGAVPKT